MTAFLVTAGTEFTTSNFYVKGVNTKLLSENVLNLVIAQLREGARSTDVNVPTTPVAWASQPGMIRTYGADGRPYRYYKLYSADYMVGSGGFDETADQIPVGSGGWSSQPNVYTEGQANAHFLNSNLFIASFLGPLAPYREQIGTIIFEFSHFHPGDWERGREFVAHLDGFSRKDGTTPLKFVMKAFSIRATLKFCSSTMFSTPSIAGRGCRQWWSKFGWTAAKRPTLSPRGSCLNQDEPMSRQLNLSSLIVKSRMRTRRRGMG